MPDDILWQDLILATGNDDFDQNEFFHLMHSFEYGFNGPLITIMINVTGLFSKFLLVRPE